MMLGLRNIFNCILAAFVFFTRLPWYKLHKVPAESFIHAAEYWPFAGWITGGVLALTFAMTTQVFPCSVALIMALSARVLLTGALHEDGWADCCDGLGGGTTRERTLQIMKDSHIGTFGVLGLVLYFFLAYQTLVQLIPLAGSVRIMASTLFTADVWGKCVASLLTGQLKYLRKVEDSKSGVIYASFKCYQHVLRLGGALVPVGLLWCVWGGVPHPLFFFAPVMVECLWAAYLKFRIGGYTGDCCGAAFLLCELSMYLVLFGVGYC